MSLKEQGTMKATECTSTDSGKGISTTVRGKGKCWFRCDSGKGIATEESGNGESGFLCESGKGILTTADGKVSNEEGSNVTVVKGSQQQRVTKVVLKWVPM